MRASSALSWLRAYSQASCDSVGALAANHAGRFAYRLSFYLSEDLNVAPQATCCQACRRLGTLLLPQSALLKAHPTPVSKPLLVASGCVNSTVVSTSSYVIQGSSFSSSFDVNGRNSYSTSAIGWSSGARPAAEPAAAGPDNGSGSKARLKAPGRRRKMVSLPLPPPSSTEQAAASENALGGSPEDAQASSCSAPAPASSCASPAPSPDTAAKPPSLLRFATPAERRQPTLAPSQVHFLWNRVQDLERIKLLRRVRVGRAGLTPGFVANCGRLLEEHELLRVSFSPDITTDTSFGKFVLENCLDCRALKVKGRTVTFYRDSSLSRPSSSYEHDASISLPLGTGQTSSTTVWHDLQQPPTPVAPTTTSFAQPTTAGDGRCNTVSYTDVELQQRPDEREQQPLGRLDVVSEVVEEARPRRFR